MQHSYLIFFKARDVTTKEEMDSVFAKFDYSFRFDCGFSKVITMDNRHELLSLAWKHYVLYSLYAEISEFRNGFLTTLKMKQLVILSPKVVHQLLLAENAIAVNVDSLQDLFVADFSEKGSNARKIEETIMHNWCTFLEEVSGENARYS